MRPVLQLALDFVDLPRALQVAEESLAGGADWLEVGTPLIKSEGLEAIRQIKSRWPDKVIVADMKTMDAGRAEVECAAKAGARVVGVLGAASDATIKECIEAAKNYGAQVVVDMIQVDDVVARAKTVEAFGADYVGIHLAIDRADAGQDPLGYSARGRRSDHRPHRRGRRHQLPDGCHSDRSRRFDRGRGRRYHQGGRRDRRDRLFKKAMETGKAVKIRVLRARHWTRHPRNADARLSRQCIRRPTPQRRHPGTTTDNAGCEDGRPCSHRTHSAWRLGQAG